MAIVECTFRIEGVSSLLMHNPAGMGGAKTGISVKKIPTQAEEMEAGFYKFDDNTLYAPAIWFRSSLINGAKGRKLGKSAATTVLAGSVFSMEDKVRLYDPLTGKTLTTEDAVPHSTRAVVGTAGVLRTRPELQRWGCEVTFEVDDDFVAPEVVEEIMNMAGRVAGVGDWRPQKKGPHGRFKATLVKAASLAESDEVAHVGS